MFDTGRIFKSTRKKERKMNKTRKIIAPSLILLIVSLIMAAIPTDAEGAIYEDTIRLHILANSDSEEDQNLKLTVRDGILKKYSDALSIESSTEDAKKRIEALLPSVKKTAEEIIRENGYSYSCSVELGEEWYDTRKYQDFSLPCGYYSSLVIRIGEAEGQNWWCVMFPPMCLEFATSGNKSSYTEEEIGLIGGGKYKIKFKTLELINNAFFR